MNKSDVIFGTPRANAPARRFINPDEPVIVGGRSMTYAEACALHTELGQTLARMMRKRGSAAPPDGDIGGTPAALAA